MEIVKIVIVACLAGWLVNFVFLFASWLAHLMNGKRNVHQREALRLSVIPFSLSLIVIYDIALKIVMMCVMFVVFVVGMALCMVLLVMWIINRIHRTHVGDFLECHLDDLFYWFNEDSVYFCEDWMDRLTRHLRPIKEAILADYEEYEKPG